jgi:hypothetical protein
VTVNGNVTVLHGMSGLFCADNLGAHSLFGFVESFSANFICRFCLAQKDDIQDKFLASCFERRSRKHIIDCSDSLNAVGFSSSVACVKNTCILNNLDYFHCTEQSIVDCMHDVLEGVIPYELPLIINSLIDRKFFTLADINNALFHFNYSSGDVGSKSPAISLSNLRIQAAEAWCLVRNLPLVIGSKVPVGDENWHLLLLLLDCLDIIFAPVVTPGLSDMPAYLIEDHHSLFKTLYSDSRLLPKHHFLIHYPEFINKFGPMSQYWCMRFEAKHRFGKELASTVCNFKNICKTIAERTQMELAHSLLTKTLFRTDHVVVSCSAAPVSCLQPELATCICEQIGLNQYDEVYFASSVMIGHYRFMPGSCAVLKCEDGVPTFEEVSIIVSVAECIYFVCNTFRTVDFVQHVHAFSVKVTENYVATLSTSLKDYHPLGVHKVKLDDNELLLIAPRYKLL